MTRRIDVALGERSYPIFIGSGLLADTHLLRSHLAGKEVFVISNQTVAPLYLQAVNSALVGLKVNELIIDDGEIHKNFASLERTFDALLAARHSRRTTIIALGGGVIGDLAGFAAACYQRGVAFIQIPTTLLAQVDSSVGGKTAINHPLGKNMIGAFHQPRAVISDVDALTTLPERELKAGLAEVIKYGVIWDSAFFAWIEGNIEALLARSPTALTHAIARSCEIKAEVVAADEKETLDIRALLNYGHTFGHAIENLTGYSAWLHGEAVAAGMVMAADLAVRSSGLADADARRIKRLIVRAGLPGEPPALSENAMLSAMGLDKKVVDGALRFILPQSIGRAFVANDVPIEALRKTLSAGPQLCQNP